MEGFLGTIHFFKSRYCPYDILELHSLHPIHTVQYVPFKNINEFDPLLGLVLALLHAE